ncbi:MAG: hypothetical protein C0597_12770 [Marinilabiliales bacterium]|nr:MAG: hypothetical protein C0597_12770 [Marinilabiliales bacterium]
MEFKKLELQEEDNRIKRLITSGRLKKSIIYILAGAFLGFIFTYFAEGRDVSQLASKEILSNVFTGAFIGFFITNSPCARGRC